jgi:hypothetical protein
MGLAENRAKSSAYAGYMKEKGIHRTAQACVWGCGAMVPINDTNGLMNHLNRCEGGGKRRFRTGRTGKGKNRR